MMATTTLAALAIATAAETLVMFGSATEPIPAAKLQPGTQSCSPANHPGTPDQVWRPGQHHSEVNQWRGVSERGPCPRTCIPCSGVVLFALLPA